MNIYETLGVDAGASVLEIKMAYRRRARELHPDVRSEDLLSEHESRAEFSRLNDAYRAAMAAARDLDEGPGAAGRLPGQRLGTATSASSDADRAVTLADLAELARLARLQEDAADDPVLTLLTLPLDLAPRWSREALTFWVLTLVPRARLRLAEARRLADAAGPISGADVHGATVHTLLTLGLSSRGPTRRPLSARHIDEAYDLIEARLPRTVRAGLPPRVTGVVRVPTA